MSLRSQFESLPSEVLSCILTQCSRDDLVNLAQTRSSLRAVCRQELINYPLTVKLTSDSLKSWAVYFGKEDILLTRGARSLAIKVHVTMQDLRGVFDDVDPTVFDVTAQPIHPDASRILPFPSSLRKLSLSMDWDIGDRLSFTSDILPFLLLLRSLPERCPHLEVLSIAATGEHPSDEFDKCIRRLTHLRKLYIHAWSLPIIPNRLSLLPASLTDLCLRTNDIQTQEEVATAVPWVRGIRKIELMTVTPQCTTNALRILSRGGASHLTELTLREVRNGVNPANPANPAATRSSREALTVGLREFSLLQPPLHRLSLKNPHVWSDSLHLPLLHTAVASTLTQLSLWEVDSCLFPSHLPWPHLQSLRLRMVSKMGYQGPLTEPIFPVLTAIAMFQVDEIQAPEDLFPALETIKWKGATTPEQVTSLVRHDSKRIEMTTYNMDVLFEPLWEAMGGHTVDLIAFKDSIPEWMKEHAKHGKPIFPGFPNIREVSLLGCSSSYTS